MDIITGDRAVFTGGVLKIRDIPILYIPAGYLPMDQTRKICLHIQVSAQVFYIAVVEIVFAVQTRS